MTKKKIKLDILAKFFDTTRQTVARWEKDEKKPVLAFTYKYLDAELLEEFFQNGEIRRFESMNFDELSGIGRSVFLNASRKVLNEYKNIDTLNFKYIINDFLNESKYKILYLEMDKCLQNIELVKDHFYNELTLFLHKNRDKYSSKEKRAVNDFMCTILNKEDIYLNFYLAYIELLKDGEIKRINRDIENQGLEKALINKFFIR